MLPQQILAILKESGALGLRTGSLLTHLKMEGNNHSLTEVALVLKLEAMKQDRLIISVPDKIDTSTDRWMLTSAGEAALAQNGI